MQTQVNPHLKISLTGKPETVSTAKGSPLNLAPSLLTFQVLQ